MSFTDEFIVDSDKFERLMIGKLRNDRETIQAKTYKNWINSVLIKARTSIDDIYGDLRNGQKLIILLEVITGEKIAEPNKGNSVLHKIENVSRCLKFIRNKNVYLESIGPEDIVNGNKRLTLGLIWTIILRFQLSQHLDFMNYDLKSIKDSLLLWCQSKTSKQSNCKIKDFNNSWISGWAFVELIRSFRPELIDTQQLKKLNNVELLDRAFEIANQHLMIPKILDAEDVVNSSDENSILTYISYFYNLFCKTKSTETGSKRIKFVLNQVSDIQNVEQNYGQMVTELLSWIKQKCILFQADIDINKAHEQMSAFNDYFWSERPSQLKSRNECESVYFEILTRQKKLGVRQFVPRSGLTVKDIEKAWLHLEQIETSRQDKLKNSMAKCEQLTKVVDLFDLKCLKMEKYISDKLQLLNQIFKPDNCSNLAQLEVHLKQSELICCDILSNSAKFDSVYKLADELIEHKFNNYEFVRICKNHLQVKVRRLIDLAVHNQRTIESTNRVINYLRQLDCMQSELDKLQFDVDLVPLNRTNSTQNVFVHLEKLKQHDNYHKMLERQFLAIQSRICLLTDNNNNHNSCSILLEPTLIHSKLSTLRNRLDQCRHLIDERVTVSHLNLDFNEFKDEIEFVQIFLHEKEILCQSRIDECLDQNNIIYVQRRNNIIKLELKTMEQRFYDACQKGFQLVSRCDHYGSKVNEHIDQTKNRMKESIHVINERTFLINDTVSLFRVCDQLSEFDFSLIGENYEKLKEQVFNIMRDHDEFGRMDLVELTGLIEHINGLSINIENQSSVTDQKDNHVVFLKKYSLDQCLTDSNHAFLVVRIDQPIEFLRDMHSRLLRLVTDNFRVAQQLLSATEFDFDSNKLRNLLIEKNNSITDNLVSDDTLLNTSSIASRSNFVETEQMYDLLLSGNNLNQFIDTMQDRQKTFESDMNSMTELMSFVRNTLQLLKVTQTFTRTFVEMKKSQHKTTLTKAHNKPSVVQSPVESATTSTQHEQHQVTSDPIHRSQFVRKLNPDAFKFKVVTYKFRKNVDFIGNYLYKNIENDNISDIKFKLNFSKQILQKDLHNIDSLLSEMPSSSVDIDLEVKKTSELITTLTNSERVMDYKVKTLECMTGVEEFLNELASKVKLVDAIQIDQDRSQVTRSVNKLKTATIHMESHFRQFIDDNTELISSMSSEDVQQCKKRIDSLKQTFQQFKNLATRKTIQCRERINVLDSVPVRDYPNKTDNEPIIEEPISESTDHLSPSSSQTFIKDDNPNQTPQWQLDNLLRNMEMLLFEIESGSHVSMDRFNELMINCDEADISEQFDFQGDITIVIKNITQMKSRLTRAWNRRQQLDQLDQFNQMATQFISNCTQQIHKIQSTLLVDNANRVTIVRMYKQKYIEHKLEYQTIHKQYHQSQSGEIVSRLVCLSDLLDTHEREVNEMQMRSEAIEQLESINTQFEQLINLRHPESEHCHNKFHSLVQELDCLQQTNIVNEDRKLIRKNALQMKLNCIRAEMQTRIRALKRTMFRIKDPNWLDMFNAQIDSIHATSASIELDDDEKVVELFNNLSLINEKIESITKLISCSNANSEVTNDENTLALTEDKQTLTSCEETNLSQIITINELAQSFNTDNDQQHKLIIQTETVHKAEKTENIQSPNAQETNSRVELSDALAKVDANLLNANDKPEGNVIHLKKVSYINKSNFDLNEASVNETIDTLNTVSESLQRLSNDTNDGKSNGRPRDNVLLEPALSSNYLTTMKDFGSSPMQASSEENVAQYLTESTNSLYYSESDSGHCELAYSINSPENLEPSGEVCTAYLKPKEYDLRESGLGDNQSMSDQFDSNEVLLNVTSQSSLNSMVSLTANDRINKSADESLSGENTPSRRDSTDSTTEHESKLTNQNASIHEQLTNEQLVHSYLSVQSRCDTLSNQVKVTTQNLFNMVSSNSNLTNLNEKIRTNEIKQELDQILACCAIGDKQLSSPGGTMDPMSSEIAAELLYRTEYLNCVLTQLERQVESVERIVETQMIEHNRDLHVENQQIDEEGIATQIAKHPEAPNKKCPLASFDEIELGKDTTENVSNRMIKDYLTDQKISIQINSKIEDITNDDKFFRSLNENTKNNLKAQSDDPNKVIVEQVTDTNEFVIESDECRVESPKTIHYADNLTDETIPQLIDSRNQGKTSAQNEQTGRNSEDVNLVETNCYPDIGEEKTDKTQRRQLENLSNQVANHPLEIDIRSNELQITDQSAYTDIFNANNQMNVEKSEVVNEIIIESDECRIKPSDAVLRVKEDTKLSIANDFPSEVDIFQEIITLDQSNEFSRDSKFENNNINEVKYSIAQTTKTNNEITQIQQMQAIFDKDSLLTDDYLTNRVDKFEIFTDQENDVLDQLVQSNDNEKQSEINANRITSHEYLSEHNDLDDLQNDRPNNDENVGIEEKPGDAKGDLFNNDIKSQNEQQIHDAKKVDQISQTDNKKTIDQSSEPITSGQNEVHLQNQHEIFPQSDNSNEHVLSEMEKEQLKDSASDPCLELEQTDNLHELYTNEDYAKRKHTDEEHSESINDNCDSDDSKKQLEQFEEHLKRKKKKNKKKNKNKDKDKPLEKIGASKEELLDEWQNVDRLFEYSSENENTKVITTSVDSVEGKDQMSVDHLMMSHSNGTIPNQTGTSTSALQSVELSGSAIRSHIDDNEVINQKVNDIEPLTFDINTNENQCSEGNNKKAIDQNYGSDSLKDQSPTIFGDDIEAYKRNAHSPDSVSNLENRSIEIIPENKENAHLKDMEQSNSPHDGNIFNANAYKNQTELANIGDTQNDRILPNNDNNDLEIDDITELDTSEQVKRKKKMNKNKNKKNKSKDKALEKIGTSEKELQVSNAFEHSSENENTQIICTNIDPIEEKAQMPIDHLGQSGKLFDSVILSHNDDNEVINQKVKGIEPLSEVNENENQCSEGSNEKAIEQNYDSDSLNNQSSSTEARSPDLIFNFENRSIEIIPENKENAHLKDMEQSNSPHDENIFNANAYKNQTELANIGDAQNDQMHNDRIFPNNDNNDLEIGDIKELDTNKQVPKKKKDKNKNKQNNYDYDQMEQQDANLSGQTDEQSEVKHSNIISTVDLVISDEQTESSSEQSAKEHSNEFQFNQNDNQTEVTSLKSEEPTDSSNMPCLEENGQVVQNANVDDIIEPPYEVNANETTENQCYEDNGANEMIIKSNYSSGNKNEEHVTVHFDSTKPNTDEQNTETNIIATQQIEPNTTLFDHTGNLKSQTDNATTSASNEEKDEEEEHTNRTYFENTTRNEELNEETITNNKADNDAHSLVDSDTKVDQLNPIEHSKRKRKNKKKKNKNKHDSEQSAVHDEVLDELESQVNQKERSDSNLPDQTTEHISTAGFDLGEEKAETIITQSTKEQSNQHSDNEPPRVEPNEVTPSEMTPKIQNDSIIISSPDVKIQIKQEFNDEIDSQISNLSVSEKVNVEVIEPNYCSDNQNDLSDESSAALFDSNKSRTEFNIEANAFDAQQIEPNTTSVDLTETLKNETTNATTPNEKDVCHRDSDGKQNETIIEPLHEKAENEAHSLVYSDNQVDQLNSIEHTKRKRKNKKKKNKKKHNFEQPGVGGDSTDEVLDELETQIYRKERSNPNLSDQTNEQMSKVQIDLGEEETETTFGQSREQSNHTGNYSDNEPHRENETNEVAPSVLTPEIQNDSFIMSSLNDKIGTRISDLTEKVNQFSEENSAMVVELSDDFVAAHSDFNKSSANEHNIETNAFAIQQIEHNNDDEERNDEKLNEPPSHDKANNETHNLVDPVSKEDQHDSIEPSKRNKKKRKSTKKKHHSEQPGVSDEVQTQIDQKEQSNSNLSDHTNELITTAQVDLGEKPTETPTNNDESLSQMKTIEMTPTEITSEIQTLNDSTIMSGFDDKIQFESNDDNKLGQQTSDLIANDTKQCIESSDSVNELYETIGQISDEPNVDKFNFETSENVVIETNLFAFEPFDNLTNQISKDKQTEVVPIETNLSPKNSFHKVEFDENSLGDQTERANSDDEQKDDAFKDQSLTTIDEKLDDLPVSDSNENVLESICTLINVQGKRKKKNKKKKNKKNKFDVTSRELNDPKLGDCLRSQIDQVEQTNANLSKEAIDSVNDTLVDEEQTQSVFDQTAEHSIEHDQNELFKQEKELSQLEQIEVITELQVDESKNATILSCSDNNKDELEINDQFEPLTSMQTNENIDHLNENNDTIKLNVDIVYSEESDLYREQNRLISSNSTNVADVSILTNVSLVDKPNYREPNDLLENNLLDVVIDEKRTEQTNDDDVHIDQTTIDRTVQSVYADDDLAESKDDEPKSNETFKKKKRNKNKKKKNIKNLELGHHEELVSVLKPKELDQQANLISSKPMFEQSTLELMNDDTFSVDLGHEEAQDVIFDQFTDEHEVEQNNKTKQLEVAVRETNYFSLNDDKSQNIQESNSSKSDVDTTEYQYNQINDNVNNETILQDEDEQNDDNLNEDILDDSNQQNTDKLSLEISDSNITHENDSFTLDSLTENIFNEQQTEEGVNDNNPIEQQLEQIDKYLNDDKESEQILIEIMTQDELIDSENVLSFEGNTHEPKSEQTDNDDKNSSHANDQLMKNVDVNKECEDILMEANKKVERNKNKKKNKHKNKNSKIDRTEFVDEELADYIHFQVDQPKKQTNIDLPDFGDRKHEQSEQKQTFISTSSVYLHEEQIETVFHQTSEECLIEPIDDEQLNKVIESSTDEQTELTYETVRIESRQNNSEGTVQSPVLIETTENEDQTEQKTTRDQSVQSTEKGSNNMTDEEIPPEAIEQSNDSFTVSCLNDENEFKYAVCHEMIANENMEKQCSKENDDAKTGRDVIYNLDQSTSDFQTNEFNIDQESAHCLLDSPILVENKKCDNPTLEVGTNECKDNPGDALNMQLEYIQSQALDDLEERIDSIEAQLDDMANKIGIYQQNIDYNSQEIQSLSQLGDTILTQEQGARLQNETEKATQFIKGEADNRPKVNSMNQTEQSPNLSISNQEQHFDEKASSNEQVDSVHNISKDHSHQQSNVKFDQYSDWAIRDEKTAAVDTQYDEINKNSNSLHNEAKKETFVRSVEERVEQLADANSQQNVFGKDLRQSHIIDQLTNLTVNLQSKGHEMHLDHDEINENIAIIASQQDNLEEFDQSPVQLNSNVNENQTEPQNTSDQFVPSDNDNAIGEESPFKSIETSTDNKQEKRTKKNKKKKKRNKTKNKQNLVNTYVLDQNTDDEGKEGNTSQQLGNMTKHEQWTDNEENELNQTQSNVKSPDQVIDKQLPITDGSDVIMSEPINYQSMKTELAFDVSSQFISDQKQSRLNKVDIDQTVDDESQSKQTGTTPTSEDVERNIETEDHLKEFEPEIESDFVALKENISELSKCDDSINEGDQQEISIQSITQMPDQVKKEHSLVAPDSKQISTSQGEIEITIEYGLDSELDDQFEDNFEENNQKDDLFESVRSEIEGMSNDIEQQSIDSAIIEGLEEQNQTQLANISNQNVDSLPVQNELYTPMIDTSITKEINKQLVDLSDKATQTIEHVTDSQLNIFSSTNQESQSYSSVTSLQADLSQIEKTEFSQLITSESNDQTNSSAIMMSSNDKHHPIENNANSSNSTRSMSAIQTEITCSEVARNDQTTDGLKETSFNTNMENDDSSFVAGGLSQHLKLEHATSQSLTIENDKTNISENNSGPQDNLVEQKQKDLCDLVGGGITDEEINLVKNVTKNEQSTQTENNQSMNDLRMQKQSSVQSPNRMLGIITSEFYFNQEENETTFDNLAYQQCVQQVSEERLISTETSTDDSNVTKIDQSMQTSLFTLNKCNQTNFDEFDSNTIEPLTEEIQNNPSQHISTDELRNDYIDEKQITNVDADPTKPKDDDSQQIFARTVEFGNDELFDQQQEVDTEIIDNLEENVDRIESQLQDIAHRIAVHIHNSEIHQEKENELAIELDQTTVPNVHSLVQTEPDDSLENDSTLQIIDPKYIVKSYELNSTEQSNLSQLTNDFNEKKSNTTNQAYFDCCENEEIGNMVWDSDNTTNLQHPIAENELQNDDEKSDEKLSAQTVLGLSPNDDAHLRQNEVGLNKIYSDVSLPGEWEEDLVDGFKSKSTIEENANTIVSAVLDNLEDKICIVELQLDDIINRLTQYHNEQQTSEKENDFKNEQQNRTNGESANFNTDIFEQVNTEKLYNKVDQSDLNAIDVPTTNYAQNFKQSTSKFNQEHNYISEDIDTQSRINSITNKETPLGANMNVLDEWLHNESVDTANEECFGDNIKHVDIGIVQDKSQVSTNTSKIQSTNMLNQMLTIETNISSLDQSDLPQNENFDSTQINLKEIKETNPNVEVIQEFDTNVIVEEKLDSILFPSSDSGVLRPNISVSNIGIDCQSVKTKSSLEDDIETTTRLIESSTLPDSAKMPTQLSNYSTSSELNEHYEKSRVVIMPFNDENIEILDDKREKSSMSHTDLKESTQLLNSDSTLKDTNVSLILTSPESDVCLSLEDLNSKSNSVTNPYISDINDIESSQQGLELENTISNAFSKDDSQLYDNFLCKCNIVEERLEIIESKFNDIFSQLSHNQTIYSETNLFRSNLSDNSKCNSSDSSLKLSDQITELNYGSNFKSYLSRCDLVDARLSEIYQQLNCLSNVLLNYEHDREKSDDSENVSNKNSQFHDHNLNYSECVSKDKVSFITEDDSNNSRNSNISDYCSDVSQSDLLNYSKVDTGEKKNEMSNFGQNQHPIASDTTSSQEIDDLCNMFKRTVLITDLVDNAHGQNALACPNQNFLIFSTKPVESCLAGEYPTKPEHSSQFEESDSALDPYNYQQKEFGSSVNNESLFSSGDLTKNESGQQLIADSELAQNTKSTSNENSTQSDKNFQAIPNKHFISNFISSIRNSPDDDEDSEYKQPIDTSSNSENNLHSSATFIIHHGSELILPEDLENINEDDEVILTGANELVSEMSASSRDSTDLLNNDQMENASIDEDSNLIEIKNKEPLSEVDLNERILLNMQSMDSNLPTLPDSNRFMEIESHPIIEPAVQVDESIIPKESSNETNNKLEVPNLSEEEQTTENDLIIDDSTKKQSIQSIRENMNATPHDESIHAEISKISVDEVLDKVLVGDDDTPYHRNDNEQMKNNQNIVNLVAHDPVNVSNGEDIYTNHRYAPQWQTQLSEDIINYHEDSSESMPTPVLNPASDNLQSIQSTEGILSALLSTESSPDQMSLPGSQIEPTPSSSSGLLIDTIQSSTDGLLARLRRIARYSLPFHLLALLLFLFFYIWPQDEYEFNCLFRKEYSSNLMKSYPNGPPPQ